MISIVQPAAGQSPMLDLNDVRTIVNDYFEDELRLGGDYGRYVQNAGGGSPDLYASTDVAIARIIMGEDFSTSLTQAQREQWVGHIQSFQNPDGTHNGILGGLGQLHANGMVIGALGPLGGMQKYPVGSLYAPFDQADEVDDYLANNIDWTHQWTESHKFWGGLHMYSQSAAAPAGWSDAVFDWLDPRVDPTTGWFITGQQPANSTEGLGGGAHIWPIYEHLGHPFPEPERVIDRILEAQNAAGNFNNAAIGNYQNLDALYGLKFMSNEAPGYRTADIDSAVASHGQWLADQFGGYMAANPRAHQVLSVVGNMGLMNQLAPALYPDSTGAQWSDIFTDPALYQTQAVETFTAPPFTGGTDQPANYDGKVDADSPVAYWRLGQTSGNTAPEHQGQTNLAGTYHNLGTGAGSGNLGQPGPRPADGFDGFAGDNHAPHFNGSDSYVSIADDPALDITGPLTLEAWINVDALPTTDGNPGIIAKYLGNGDQRAFNLFLDGQGGTQALGFIVSPDGTFASAVQVIDDQAIATGQWLHVAATFEPSQFMRLYINGALVEQRTTGVPSSIFDSSADLWIGAQFNLVNPGNFFDGLIDEVAVYDEALTPQQIAAHYNASQIPEPTTLGLLALGGLLLARRRRAARNSD